MLERFPKLPEVSSARTKGQRNTEKIMKSWVRESRDRRHALLTELREAIRI
jgi:hypothetical protein